jgi:hypothetical protein
VFDHVVDLFNHVTTRRFGCSPLLNRDYQSFFKIRSIWGKVLLRENIAPSFEDTQRGNDAVRELLRFNREGHVLASNLVLINVHWPGYNILYKSGLAIFYSATTFRPGHVCGVECHACGVG